jgi:hypothetical protein
MKPFDKFIEDTLKDFEQHLHAIGIRGVTINVFVEPVSSPASS